MPPLNKKLIAAAVAPLISMAGANAATITVTTFEDGESDNCTLRDALRSVNSGENKGNCIASGSFGNADKIVFQASRGVIRLQDVDSYGSGFSTPTLYINNDVTINPSGADVTVVGAAQPGSVFSISGGGTANQIEVSITGLTLEGGSRFSGGTLYASYTKLTLSNTTITGGAAVRGGAIYLRSGSLDLRDSTLSNNVASPSAGGAGGDGGAIYLSDSSLSLQRSTLSGNRALTGGGIAAYRSTVNVTNSTISNNVAQSYGGGLISYLSDIRFNNATLSGNRASDGGGVALATTDAVLTNTIIANSSPNDCLGLISDITASNQNIIEDGSCRTSAMRGDPKLGPLADNGGITKTHVLSPGSIAINRGAGDKRCPIDDQRGWLRVDMLCDIGAFEVGAQEPTIPSPTILAPLMLLLEEQ